MRISNAERNEVTDILSKHFAEGRLDSSEFDERVGRALAAKTRGDLAGLLDDLPGLGPAADPPRHRRPVAYWLLVLLLVVAAASFLAAPPHVPWLLVALVLWVLWHHGRRHRTQDRHALTSRRW